MAKSVPVKVRLSDDLVYTSSLAKSLEEMHSMAVVELLRKEAGSEMELSALVLSMEKQISQKSGSEEKTT